MTLSHPPEPVTPDRRPEGAAVPAPAPGNAAATQDSEGIRPGPTEADRALLLALRAWGTESAEAALPRFWGRFAAEWRRSLQAVLDAGPPLDADEARVALQRALAAQARPGLAHVHPSWWVRALRDETPAVQRVVAAQAAAELRPLLQHAIGREAADLPPEHAPDPAAVRWAMALWDERLIGDLPDWPDDPPVVLALTCLELWEVLALARITGLARCALAGRDEGAPRPGAPAWSRFVHFQRLWEASDPATIDQGRRTARATLQLQEQDRGRRRGWARLGLVTFGRLLARAEPYRARWALQHLPYPLARRIRPAIKDLGDSTAQWETALLKAGWERLSADGQVRSLGGLTREHRCV